jgi:hypothetical protein
MPGNQVIRGLGFGAQRVLGKADGVGMAPFKQGRRGLVDQARGRGPDQLRFGGRRSLNEPEKPAADGQSHQSEPKFCLFFHRLSPGEDFSKLSLLMRGKIG